MTPQETKLKNAHSLKAWCDALNVPLPPPEARQWLYQSLGCGARSTYVGTAEQNARLLLALKRERGLL